MVIKGQYGLVSYSYRKSIVTKYLYFTDFFRNGWLPVILTVHPVKLRESYRHLDFLGEYQLLQFIRTFNNKEKLLLSELQILKPNELLYVKNW